MNNIHTLVGKVIDQALAEAMRREVPIYTFALYYDHESSALSVCIDTEQNSRSTVGRINSYNRRHFVAAMADSNLKGAALWCSNIGRSLSLGDFHMVNVARADLPNGFVPSQGFFAALAQSLIAAESRVSAQARDPSSLLLCCSGEDDEVQYWWSVA
ncbi:hypothetical protein [Lysobacter tyrosinilyticus]